MSDDPSTQLDLPRSQVGPNPQHLLVTLLGDYWHGRVVAIPSAAIVELLGEFGITAASARSALSRLARRGILDLMREGRTTSYRLKQEFLNAGASRADRLLSFGAEPARPWDGRCVIVTFSMPDENRRDRDALRPLLRSWGFAPLQDGAWLSVRATEEEVRAGIHELGFDGVAAFTAQLIHPVDAGARRALVDWSLERLGGMYEEFADRYADARELAARGAIAPSEALVLRTRMMDEWRTLVRLDPDLPADLLPPDWPRASARRTFEAVYDGLGPLAELRCRQIAGRHDAALVPQTWHITTAHSTEVDAPPT